MRKVLSAIVVVASSFALLHCAGSPSSSSSESPGPSKEDNQTAQHQSDAGSKPDTAAPFDAAPPPRDAARPDAADAKADAAKPPPPPPPLACTELASCCVELTDSTAGGACLATVGYGQAFSSQYAQIAACAAGYALYDCASAGIQTELGPNCAQLVACCKSQDYGPYIGNDSACTDDWKQQNEDLCGNDLAYYQGDTYGDCL
jgi:hypothetical protein